MSLPPSLTQKLREEQPDRRNWNQELEYLVESSFEARPLQLPGIGQIRPKNTEVAYYWVRLKRGDNPDYTRYLQMKAAGYRNATLEDVDPLLNAVKPNADGTEITCGVDLILMCAHPSIHYGALKFHQEKAISMTNPRGRTAQDAMMRSGNFNQDDQNALRASNTRSADTQVESRADANSENALQVGSPKWKEIAKDKGGKVNG
jgi:hypothetical protein